jgi:hypothetical protein
MIIQTRYRDIPASEVECGLNFPEIWAECRGRAVEIYVPAVPPSNIGRRGVCNGPFFRVVGKINPDGCLRILCVHMAEIGD